MEITNHALPQNLGEAKVIADSTCHGNRVTTLEVTIHRFMLPEWNTHRVFSRNSASSRAIPALKQLDKVDEAPAFPFSLRAEQPGMQGGSELQGDARIDAILLLDELHGHTTDTIRNYINSHAKEDRLHKSVLSRYLEPFMWHKIIVTATDWQGFFGQRIHEAAQDEIHYPAYLVKKAWAASTPDILKPGEWHLPYVTNQEKAFETLETQLKLSTARCARVSYLNHDGVHDPDADARLWNRLTEARPEHASPLEHPCQADPSNSRMETLVKLDGTITKLELPRIGNLKGFMQARHLVVGH